LRPKSSQQPKTKLYHLRKKRGLRTLIFKPDSKPWNCKPTRKQTQKEHQRTHQALKTCTYQHALIINIRSETAKSRNINDPNFTFLFIKPLLIFSTINKPTLKRLFIRSSFLAGKATHARDTRKILLHMDGINAPPPQTSLGRSSTDVLLDHVRLSTSFW
jgi:hypothetical protein